MMSNTGSDPEDILSTALQTLYSYVPVVHSSAGLSLTRTVPVDLRGPKFEKHAPPGPSLCSVTVQTPDTHSSNWSLQASSVWMSAVFLADHIYELDLFELPKKDEETGEPRRLEILELGAGAGLPGIMLAKMLSERQSDSWPAHDWRVTLSDYPDDSLIRALEDNVRQNIMKPVCRVVPFAWGSDATALLESTSLDLSAVGFDLVLAADTLWNLELHVIFCKTLECVLRRSPSARIHLVAGLHTSPYTIQGFLRIVNISALEVESIRERKVDAEISRDWSANREEWEDEMTRRRWVVWIVLKWKEN